MLFEVLVDPSVTVDIVVAEWYAHDVNFLGYLAGDSELVMVELLREKLNFVHSAQLTEIGGKLELIDDFDDDQRAGR